MSTWKRARPRRCLGGLLGRGAGPARELHGKGRGRPLPRRGASSCCSPGFAGEGVLLHFVTVSTEFGDAPRDSEVLMGGGLVAGGRELRSLQEVVS